VQARAASLRIERAAGNSRPRALPIKRTPEFVAHVDHIRRLIEDDVRASVIDEHA
jgi:hypothetical protein